MKSEKILPKMKRFTLTIPTIPTIPKVFSRVGRGLGFIGHQAKRFGSIFQGAQRRNPIEIVGIDLKPHVNANNVNKINNYKNFVINAGLMRPFTHAELRMRLFKKIGLISLPFVVVGAVIYYALKVRGRTILISEEDYNYLCYLKDKYGEKAFWTLLLILISIIFGFKLTIFLRAKIKYPKLFLYYFLHQHFGFDTINNFTDTVIYLIYGKDFEAQVLPLLRYLFSLNGYAFNQATIQFLFDLRKEALKRKFHLFSRHELELRGFIDMRRFKSK